MIRIRFLLTLFATLFSGCTSSGAPTPTTEPTALPTEAPTAVVTETSVTPTTEAINAPLPLVIWIPEPLNPISNAETNALLEAQFADFEAEHAGIEVTWRRKKVEDVGGIISTLRTGSTVAPGALPDLTLLRRSDLLLAVQLGLVQPLGGRASSAITGDLYDAAQRLGQVNGELYGLPYMLETQHLVYRPPLSLVGWTFADVLARDLPFVFPAARANGVNDVFLAQYLSALPADEAEQVINGTLPIDEDALNAVLSFYDQAVENSVVMPSVLDLNAPIDYAAYLGEGAVVVTSTTYLTIVSRGEQLEFAPIPTLNGNDVTILDGWMWVLTTSNAERQDAALELLNWMMDAQRHGEYSDAVHMVPSQRSTLRRWEDATYSDFVDMLLGNAFLPLSEGAATRARSMQNALGSVLLGQRTPEEATQDVLNQVGG